MSSRLTLVSGLVIPPAATLIAHEFMYLASMQSCPHALGPVAYLIPIGALIVIAFVTRAATRDYNAMREEHGPALRTAGHRQSVRAPVPHAELFAAAALAIGCLCALVVLAQWLAVVMFGTCTRL